MGEFAEMAIEQGIDEMLSDDYDDYDEPLPKICVRCGLADLHWDLHNGGWRLFDDEGVVHSCFPK